LKRFGLSAGERIKSKVDFDKLYSTGKVILSGDRKIKAVYLVEENSISGNIKIAIAISSKTGKAVWRNRLKRLLRTSYRLNKERLLNLCISKKILLKIIFSPYQFNEQNNRDVALDEVIIGTEDILMQLERRL
jgi:ribonuclease P protein component